MINCLFTEREFPGDQASSEHIIPLALSGVDGVELLVRPEAHADWGSALGGQFAKEFVTALRHIELDTRRQSRQEPRAIVKHASYGEDNRPAQVSFHAERGIKV